MYGLLINRRKVKSTNKINCRCLGGMLFGQGFDSPHLHQIVGVIWMSMEITLI